MDGAIETFHVGILFGAFWVGEGMFNLLFLTLLMEIFEKLRTIVCLDHFDRDIAREEELNLLKEVSGVLRGGCCVCVGNGKSGSQIHSSDDVDTFALPVENDGIQLEPRSYFVWHSELRCSFSAFPLSNSLLEIAGTLLCSPEILQFVLLDHLANPGSRNVDTFIVKEYANLLLAVVRILLLESHSPLFVGDRMTFAVGVNGYPGFGF